MQPLIAAVCGSALIAGALLFVASLRPPRERAASAPSRTQQGPSKLRLMLGLTPQTNARAKAARVGAVAAGMVAWLLTGWVVLVVILPGALLFLPSLIRPRTNETAIKRVEALEEWLRNLQGVITVGMGIESALQASQRSAPLAIRTEVATLAANLRSGWDSVDALRAFADDINSATGDLIVSSLILAVQRRGSGLGQVLAGLADSVAQDVRMQRLVEADRAKPRSTARWITLITLGVMVVAATQTSYIAPYGTPVGQVVLLVLLVLYALALLWMRSMTIGRPMPRFLNAVSPRVLQEVEQ
jgi:Flp pilus assembly protein TadB